MDSTPTRIIKSSDAKFYFRSRKLYDIKGKHAYRAIHIGTPAKYMN